MIYYFTGTGNSRYIARELHQQLNADYISMNTLIRNNDHSLQNIQGTLVFVVPTYAWRIPRIVEEWIRLTVFKDVEEVYFVMDCGGNIGNAVIIIENYVRRRGSTIEVQWKSLCQKTISQCLIHQKMMKPKRLLNRQILLLKKQFPISISIYLFLICHYN